MHVNTTCYETSFAQSAQRRVSAHNAVSEPGNTAASQQLDLAATVCSLLAAHTRPCNAHVSEKFTDVVSHDVNLPTLAGKVTGQQLLGSALAIGARDALTLGKQNSECC